MATPAPGASAGADGDRLHPILEVFFSPAAAMDSLARKPQFVLALLLITLIGIGAMAIAQQRGVIEHGMRAKFESNPRLEQMPAAQRERMIEQSLRFASYSVVGGAVVGPAIGLLLTSGVLLLLTNVLLGAGARFRQLLAVVAHAWLPLALHGLISIPILLAKDPETIDFQNVVPMANLSFLFSSTEQHKLYMIGSSLDLFSFWVIGLLTVGLARLTGKSTGLILAIVLAPWALYVVIFKALRG